MIIYQVRIPYNKYAIGFIIQDRFNVFRVSESKFICNVQMTQTLDQFRTNQNSYIVMEF